MKSVIFVFLVALIQFGTGDVCNANEELKDRGADCANCDNYLFVKCAPQNITKCYCKDGYIRRSAQDLTCVKPENCPKPIKCGENEEVVDCKNPCQPSCQRPVPPICYFLVCNKGCVCKSGYLRDWKSGKCVPIKDCKGLCGENQEYTDCGASCPKTCGEIKGHMCTDNCVPGCVCKEGFIYDGSEDKCVKHCKSDSA